MMVYIVTEYDRYEDEVISRKVYTEQALKRHKNNLIKEAERERNEQIRQEDKRHNKTTTERELLNSEMDRLNEAIEEAKRSGNDVLYRSFRRERKRISHRINGIASEHKRNLWVIEQRYNYRLREIMDSSEFEGAIVEKVELVL